MMLWAIQATFYLVVASLATYVSRKHPVWIVGLSLVLTSALSSIGFFAAAFELRPSIEIATVWLVCAVSALLLISDARNARVYQAVLLIGLLDVGFCGAIFLQIGLFDEPTLWLRRTFDFTVNVAFIGQCLSVSFPGACDAYLGWLRAIDRRRALDSSDPDFDWLIEQADRIDR